MLQTVRITNWTMVRIDYLDQNTNIHFSLQELDFQGHQLRLHLSKSEIPIDLHVKQKGQKLLISPFQSEISDVPTGCNCDSKKCSSQTYRIVIKGNIGITDFTMSKTKTSSHKMLHQ